MLSLCISIFIFFIKRQVMVVDPVALEQVIPGGGRHILAAVLVPFDVGLVPQDPRAFLAHIRNGHERSDVKAHAVV